MRGSERRTKMVQMLRESNSPVAGKDLATHFGVSRQVIVQDIALLRAQNLDILSTNHGYILKEIEKVERVFKVHHNDDQTREELQLIIDFGGCIEDVFVYHKVYGVVKAELNIRSRMDIDNFLADIKTGKSSLLKNVTAGYHYHTVSAPTEVILNLIQTQLEQHGFLAPLQDYEPIDFWKSEE
ncbi:MAG: transcription repressor NadR [Firmicutes bacterium]|nr:transcription repressor NadR [Bacillota bacterium]